MVKLERAKRVGRKFQAPVETRVGGPSMMFKVLPLYLTNRAETVPKVPPGPFRTDAMVYAAAPKSGLRVTWFGHSSLLIEIDGVRLLVDPVWDERASPWQRLGPKRFFPPTLPLGEIPPLDAVLISHDHFDHLGEGTVRELARLQPEAMWLTSLGVGSDLRRFGVRAERILEMDWTESNAVPGGGGAEVRVTAVPARHFSGRRLSNRNETLWSSFVLTGERHRVYVGADSGFWEGFAAIGAEYGPFDLCMLEIGAFNELWRDIHLGPDGAAAAFAELGGGVLMPVHWGLFDLALHPWRQPMERLIEVAGERRIRVFSPEPGRPEDIPEQGSLVADWWTGRE